MVASKTGQSWNRKSKPITGCIKDGWSEITGQLSQSHSKAVAGKLYSLVVGFSGEGAPLPAQILAGQRRGQSSNELRFSLSHVLPHRTSLKLTGPEAATRPSCGDALHVNGIRSSATDAAASRRTMSITIGLGSVAVAAPVARRPSLSSRCFLSLTPITACWRAVRRCGGDLWSTAPEKRRRLRSRTLIARPILPHSAVGRTV